MPLNETEDLPWNRDLSNWQPFKIDALGLVTLLGAEEINQSLGRLVASRYLEYFPLLGAFVITGERFKEKRPSFNLYNITDGINTTELSFWLTRWMLEQEFEPTRSVVHFEVPSEPRSFLKWHIVGAALAFIFTGFLVVMTFIIGDWYGFANAVSMILSVAVRAFILQVHRNAIDKAVIEASKNKPTPLHADKKCLIIMSDSKAVTVWLPGELIISVFTSNPQPQHKLSYHLLRYFGWVVFVVHIITIGMATLVPQMYTVALLVLSTVLICWKLGCDDSKWQVKFDRRILNRQPHRTDYECWIGTRLKAYVTEWPVDSEFERVKDHDSPQGRWDRVSPTKEMTPESRSKKRSELYAWLNLSDEEEESMAKWDLFPHMRSGNKGWWDTYNEKKALIAAAPPDTTQRRQDDVMIGMTSLHRLDSDGYDTVSDPNGSSPEIVLLRRGRSKTWLTAGGNVGHGVAASPSPPPRAQSASTIASALYNSSLPAISVGVDPNTISPRPTHGRSRSSYLSGRDVKRWDSDTKH